MAPRTKTSGKTKKAASAKDTPAFDPNDPIGKIIDGVMRAGYSYHEAERAFDQLWQEDLDVDQTDLAISLVVSKLQNNEVINDSKKEAATEIDDVTLLEQKLQQVINLPDLNDVLDGLIRWYNGVTPNEQRVLTNGDIIHNLLLRMLQTKKLSIKSGLLAAFFKCVYCVSTDVSNSLEDSFLSIYKNLPHLSVSVTCVLKLFERIIHNLGGDMDSEKSVFMHCGNLMCLINESKQMVMKIEGDDPKSRFMRRDQQFKSVKLQYDLLASSASIAGKPVPSMKPVVLTDYITVGGDAEAVIHENERLSKELTSIAEEREKVLHDPQEEKKELEKSMTDLQRKKAELLKELELVENQLASTSSRLSSLTKEVKEKEEGYRRQTESLEMRIANTAVLASTARADSEVVNQLNKLQDHATVLIEEGSKEIKKTAILEDTFAYLTSEQECMSFLETRSANNKKEADATASLIQKNGFQEELVQNVGKLRRSVANDLETVKSLRHFAQEIEKACSSMLDEELIAGERQLVISVYLGFYKLHVERTLSDSLYELFREELNGMLPKAVVKEKVIEVKKVKENSVKEVKKVSTGKKWGHVNKVNAKSMDDIRKETLEKK